MALDAETCYALNQLRVTDKVNSMVFARVNHFECLFNAGFHSTQYVPKNRPTKKLEIIQSNATEKMIEILILASGCGSKNRKLLHSIDGLS